MTSFFEFDETEVRRKAFGGFRTAADVVRICGVGNNLSSAPRTEIGWKWECEECEECEADDDVCSGCGADKAEGCTTTGNV